MIAELARCIRGAGLDVGIVELEDILWLAERLPLAEAAGPVEGVDDEADQPRVGAGDEETESGRDAQRDESGASAPGRTAAQAPSTALHAPTLAGTIHASTLRVRGVASTDAPEDLRRALQPFARRVPSPWRVELDEDATATRSAEVGGWCPVYTPVRERWFDLRVVVEASPSLDLWQQTLDEFVHLLRNQGGFKSVSMVRWSESGGDQVSTPDGRRTMAMSKLLEPDRPQLVLLATDGTSRRWRSGAAQAFVCAIGERAAVSIVQLLPRRSWRHTVVGEPDLRLYAQRPGDANVAMGKLLPWWIDESDAQASTCVPVIGLDAASIRQWARTMAARGGASVQAVMVDPEARPDDGAASAAGTRDDSPAARVARFRAMVSREAYDLAVFLSVPDPLTVPVMRLVQRTMLPATGTAELAEFFVGGLLERVAIDAGEGEACYRFFPGVRDELLRSLRYSEEGLIEDQLRAVGRYLAQEHADGPGFEAFFRAPAGRHRMTEWSLPFASLSRQVLAGEALQATGALPAEDGSPAVPAPAETTEPDAAAQVVQQMTNEPTAQVAHDRQSPASKLAAACSVVPNFHNPTHSQSIVWFGSGLALTAARRTPGDARRWEQADLRAMADAAVDVWEQLLTRRYSRGKPTFVDDDMERIALRERGEHRSLQLVALFIPSVEGGRPVMPLASDTVGLRPGTECELLYGEGEHLRCDHVTLASRERTGVLLLNASPNTEVWPLPPEAAGAAVILGDTCIGVVVDLGNGHTPVVANDSRTVRAALRVAWVMRLHQQLEEQNKLSKVAGAQRLYVRLPGADLSGIDLHGEELVSAVMPGTRFNGARLDRCDFGDADLSRTRFKQASLNGASFVNTTLASANFKDADLRGANFSGAVLRGVNFDGANLRGCLWDHASFDEGAFDRLRREHPEMAEVTGIEPALNTGMRDDAATAAMTPIWVRPASAGFSVDANAVPSEPRWRFLAIGDSWFSPDPKRAHPSSLLHKLAFPFHTLAVDCTPAYGSLTLASHMGSNRFLREALLRAQRWDGILLSFGGDDLLAAVGTPAVETDGRPVPLERRLLRTPAEWLEMEQGVHRYISREGFDTLAGYLRANLEQLMKMRDEGPSHGCPMFIHGYADPVPRPAPMSSGVGPWLQPAFAAYGVPIEHHMALARGLFGLLRDALQAMARDTQRFSQVHFFDSSTIVKLRPASANQPREDGDWLSEAHPNDAGYQGLASAWSGVIHAVLSAQATA